MYNPKAIKKYEDAWKQHQKGSFANAERAYRQALKISPEFVEAHNNLGNLYLDSGRFNKAVRAYQDALKLMPDHPKLLNNVGNALQCQGEFAAARDWFQRALARDPDYANAQANLGNTLWALGHKHDAVEAYRRALTLDSSLADTHTHLGGLYTELGQLADAVASFDRALGLNPDDARACQGIGRVRNEQGRLAEAVDAYQRAITLEPDNAELREELGKVYSDHGDAEQSLAAYQAALAIDPDHARAHRAIARNTRYTEYDEHIRSMESLLERKSLTDDDRIELGYALGKAHEDLGDYDRSMDYLRQAGSLRRASLEYSIDESRDEFARIQSVFDADFFARHANSGVHDPCPIFVLGMPRSGTSLVEQILASHPDCHGAGEINDLASACETVLGTSLQQLAGFPDRLVDASDDMLREMGEQYLSRIRKLAPEARCITDKLPHNFLRIGLIRAILPEARVIHCTRDPMDTCLSIYKTYLVKGHPYSCDLEELGQYYRLYQALMAHWQATLPGFIHEQNYEALVHSPEEQVAALLQHCGLDWHDDCLNFHRTRRKIGTASSAQVSQPIYTRSIDLWKAYGAHLEPLQAALTESG